MPRTSLNLIIALGCLLAVALACNFSASTANISNLKVGKDKNVSSESSSFASTDTIYAVGTVSNAPDVPFPEGFNAKPAPFGLSFTGTACSEPRLLELAYSFEHATKRRVPPSSAP